MTGRWLDDSDPMADDYPVSEHTLERLRFTLRRAMPGQLLRDSAQVNKLVDHIGDRMVLEFRAQVLGEHLPPLRVDEVARQQTDFPRTWKDHLRLGWVGQPGIRGWIAKRWPPKLQTVTTSSRMTADISSVLTYPKATILVDPALGSPLIVMDQPNPVVSMGVPSVGPKKQTGFPCRIRHCPVPGRNLVVWRVGEALFGESAASGERIYLCTGHLRALESAADPWYPSEHDPIRFDVLARESDR